MNRRRPERPTTYAARTHASRYWIVRHAHEERFRVARELVAAANPLTLLDYGCGDGQFLIELITADILSPCAKIWAFEPIDHVIESLGTNLARFHCDDRVDVVTDINRLPDIRFDYVVCMGVLEHLPLLPRFAIYDFLENALTPEGAALIDVPIEIGPSILIKEFARRFLKGDPPDYALLELLRVAAGGSVFDPMRFDPSHSAFISRHRGFDHRLLSHELERRFTIVQRRSTPLPSLPPWLCNQELLFTLRLVADSPVRGSG